MRFRSVKIVQMKQRSRAWEKEDLDGMDQVISCAPRDTGSAAEAKLMRTQ